MNQIESGYSDFEQEARKLRREMQGERTILWLLALDTAIRRVAGRIAGLARS